MQLKTNFHFHTSDDPKDNIGYTAYEAMDRAHALGFEVLAITCHEKFAHTKEYENYAREKNILLIPGIEAKIEGRHVVILNCQKDSEGIKTFEDLKNYRAKNPQIFIIAPHPFIPYLPKVSLGKNLEKNIDLFDAVEKTIFSNKIFNFNKKAEKIAKKHGKPFMATSDTHELKYLDDNYVVINALEKTPEAIFGAIKRGIFKNTTKPMNTLTMPFYLINAVLRKIINRKALPSLQSPNRDLPRERKVAPRISN